MKEVRRRTGKEVKTAFIKNPALISPFLIANWLFLDPESALISLDNPSLFDEKQLLTLVAGGDQKAFTVLVDLYWNQVYGHALAYVKSSPRAQEVTQDVFLHLWNKRDRLPEVNNFKNYLFILGRNRIISSMRKKLDEPADHDHIETLREVLTPDQQLRYKEVYALILDGIEQLPPARKTIFKMSRLEGMSYEEIARRMNISKNTVKGHIVLALNFLRTWLHVRGHLLPLLLFLSFF